MLKKGPDNFSLLGVTPNVSASIRCRVAACLLTWVKCGATGIPRDPQWEGGLELDSDDDDENENENNDVTKRATVLMKVVQKITSAK